MNIIKNENSYNYMIDKHEYLLLHVNTLRYNELYQNMETFLILIIEDHTLPKSLCLTSFCCFLTAFRSSSLFQMRRVNA